MNSVLPKLRSFNPFHHTAVKCGHRTKRSGPVSVFGHNGEIKLPKNEDGSIDYCLDCIVGMAIQCVWCAHPILPWSPITLYTPRGDFQVPDHAVVYNQDPLQLVGCLGWDCAVTGADRAGFWIPGEDGKGYVRRVPTVFEAMMQSEVPSTVIVNDTHDMEEAERLTSESEEK